MAGMKPITSYEELRQAVENAGCFDRSPWRSVASLVVHLLISGALFWGSRTASNWALSIACFVAGSFMFYRLGWIMHDAAHGGVFDTATANRRFAALAAGILGEFPSGWRYGHNRHHAAPNVRGRDMDQSERWDPERRYRSYLAAFVGLLAFSRFRGWYLPKTLLLVGLRDGYFCHRHNPGNFKRELAGSLLGFSLQLGFFTWLFGGWAPLLFFLHTSIGLIYLNTVFAGNHYDLESFDEAQAEQIPFADLQIRTTRNYPDGLLAAFVFGGLEYQIEHHLFPNMPRHGLPKAAPFVRAFCENRGLSYRVEPFARSIDGVLRFHIDPQGPIAKESK